MEALQAYTIRFSGLKNGFHYFDYEIGADFFKLFNGSLVDSAHLKVALELERKTSGLVLHFKLTGELEMPCDRCLKEIQVPASSEAELVVKLSAEPGDGTDNLWFLPSTAYEINVGQFLYETISLMVPLRALCGQENSDSCLADFEALMQQYDGSAAKEEEDGDIDPRWEKLKNLKLN